MARESRWWRDLRCLRPALRGWKPRLQFRELIFNGVSPTRLEGMETSIAQGGKRVRPQVSDPP